MVKRIDAAQKTKASNLATYYTFSGDEISTRSTITTLEMINLDILKIFKHTYIIGDEIEFNPYVIMLNKRADVTFEKVHLDCRTGNVKTRLPKILYVTDHRFSKTRLTRTQEIPKRISKIIIDHLGQKHDNLLLCVNKDQKENKVFESILDKIFNTKTTSPITKGINNLQSNSLIACLFNMDMDISSKHILSDITGISFDELETYIHRNNLIQNLFRGVLRNPNSKEICDFIAPSKIDAEYLQNRLFKELGYKVNIELLDDDINKLFVSGKSGRPTKSNSGVVLKGNDKSALSKLRKRFGERVNDIEPIYLISKMKGLMKEKAQNMFDKLVAEYEQKANHIPKTFADLKTE